MTVKAVMFSGSEETLTCLHFSPSGTYLRRHFALSLRRPISHSWSFRTSGLKLQPPLESGSARKLRTFLTALEAQKAKMNLAILASTRKEFSGCKLLIICNYFLLGQVKVLYWQVCTCGVSTTRTAVLTPYTELSSWSPSRLLLTTNGSPISLET